ncbi:MAG: lipoyl synthase, partial [Pseudomonadota bacterium]|nr:lipoyl synthase [Pseudomonadota bacterium]
MTDKNRLTVGEKLRGAEKVRRIPIKVIPTEILPPKPKWLRVRVRSNQKIERTKEILRNRSLASVCEEASCPNLSECFSRGTATFMIMGEICTRRCPFCDVAHGKPKPLDENEPKNLARAIQEMKLTYCVITSVDRDDLRDCGAAHFSRCIAEVRKANPRFSIEVLVPDFRGRKEIALEVLTKTPPDVFNHNLETIPRLYKKARPGADYAWSLSLLKSFKQLNPGVPTKSGLMLGLGEHLSEVKSVMSNLRENEVDMLTLGQYLQPSKQHLKVERFISPKEFD